MKKLIDEWIKTIKKDNQFYTYCSLWDNPNNPKDKPFPNEAVGIEKTKEASFDNFMKFEAKRQKLLEKIKRNMEEMK